MALPAVSEALSRSLLFKSLSVAERDAVAAKGKPMALMPGSKVELGKEPLAFMYVLLQGKLRLTYRESSIFSNGTIEHNAGRFFGRMDQALGLGKLSRIEALETCVLLTFDKESTLSILQTYVTVKQQVARVKTAVEARIQQRAMDAQGIREDRIDARAAAAAPRYNISSKGLIVRLAPDQVGQIRDVSSSGMFVMGALSLAVGETLTTTLDCPALDILDYPLALTIVRKDPAGLGCRFTFQDDSEQAQWEDVLVQLKTLEFQVSFEQHLTTLPKAFAASFAKDDQSLRVKVLRIGVEGALVESASPLPAGIGLFSFSLDSAQEGKIHLQTDCECVRTEDTEHLLRFLELSLTGEQTLRSLLKRRKAPVVAPPQEAVDVSGVEGSREIIEVRDQKELNQLYVRELAYNMLVLYACTRYAVGDVVDVAVRILFTPRKRGLKNPDLMFKGRVNRVVNANAVLELIDPNPETLEILSEIVTVHQNDKVTSDLRKQEEDPFTERQRQILRLVMLVVLMGVVWLWFYLEGSS